MGHTIAEYIWIDGGEPTSRVRSKTWVLKIFQRMVFQGAVF